MATAGILAAVVAVVAYLAARGVARFAGDPAANARRVLAVEDRLGIAWERDIQAWSIRHAPFAVDAGAAFYTWAYWPTVIGALLLTLCRDRTGFRLLRDGMLATGLIGLVCMALLPVTPPRLMGGFVDTVARGPTGLVARPPGLVNEHAAFPSFHVGWFALSTYVLVRHASRAVRWVRRCAVAAMVAAVVVTANHYLLDVVAGLALVPVALAFAERAARGQWWARLAGGPPPTTGAEPTGTAERSTPLDPPEDGGPPMEHPIGERRRSSRQPVGLDVGLTRGPERPRVEVDTVDASADGLLVRLPEQGTALAPGDRVLLSFTDGDGSLHVLAWARRCERGADGHWYVAVEFDDMEPFDRRRLDRLLGVEGVNGRVDG